MKTLLTRFIGNDAAEMGNELAQELARRYPLPLDGKGLPKISADRLSRILEGVYTKAQSMRDERGLGFFRKTRLCHAFKWNLLEKGYGEEFVNMSTEGLVVYLSKPLPNNKKPPL
ncbi:MAG: hypothetical protein AB1831_02395 [Pseudomonadota bacterium]